MNSSNLNEMNSGFSSNFSFNAPPAASVPRSGSVFVKSRVWKRRTINKFNAKPDNNDDDEVVPGVNPFVPQSGFASGGSGVGEFGFRADRVGLVGKGNSLTEGLIEEMKNFKIGIGSKESAGVVGSSGLESSGGDGVCSSFKGLSASSKLGEDMIGKGDSLGYNASAKEGSIGNTVNSVLRNLETELPHELKKKLNIVGSKEVHESNVVGNGGSVEKGNDSDASRERMEAELADQMKTLNMKDQAKVNDTASTSQSNDKPGLVFGDSRKEEAESVLLSEMEKKLNIESKAGNSSGKPIPGEFSFEAKTDAKFSTNSQAPPNVSKDYTSLSGATASTSYVFSSSSKSFQTGEGVSSDGPQKNDGFTFTARVDDSGASSVELRTPLSKVNQVPGFGQKIELNAKKEKHKNSRLKKKKGTLRQATQNQPQIAQKLVSGQSIPPEVPEVSETYSPMDVSPYQEALADDRSSRETSATSNESFVMNSSYSVTFSRPSASNDTTEEELVAAAERMDINGGEESTDVRVEASNDAFAKGLKSEGPTGLSASDSQTASFKTAADGFTESFKTAADGFDFVEDNSVTSAAKSESLHNLDYESEKSGECVQSSFPLHGEDAGESNFTFSAASASQKQCAAEKRNNKKKSWIKGGQGSRSFKSVTENPYPSSSFKFSVTSIPLLSQLDRGDRSMPHCKDGKPAEINKGQDMQPQYSPTSPISAAQEACEKWRLRGNQAYRSGDLSKAEDFYTHGISCVSQNDMSRGCLRALMLCYSNRAATRISLGRIRDALTDCMMASEIDPNFFKVQLRAANCHLVLGEIDEASRYYKNCLQSGSDVCVDRKVAVEASEGIQKAQKVSNCMKHSADLLLTQTPDNVENALEIIAEALMISSYSENLLAMKAEALFMLQRYEEVILLCEKTLDSAEKNFFPINANSELAEQNYCDAKGMHYRIWRCRLILKSYFQLGKLEEGLACLEKQEHLLSAKYRNGNSLLSSSIPLLGTVRELTHLKAVGNEAFQAGHYTEAIEKYTVALSCSVESWPFAAVCFCNRAAAYKALGQITDAIADCNLAIALDGNYLKAISRRATLYEMIRDYDQAAADLQRVVSILTKQVEEKTIKTGAYDRSFSCVNDLRQAQLRLSEYEEAARKEIPLDMYLILGVEPSVSASDIKKAYRKAALRHHPDKAGQFLAKGDNVDENLWKQIAVEVHKDTDRLFKMIGEAYAVLSDPGKRSRYDLEEELRKTQKKRNGAGTSRTQMDDSKHPFDRSASRQQWRDISKSYYSQPRSAETTRWTRHT